MTEQFTKGVEMTEQENPQENMKVRWRFRIDRPLDRDCDLMTLYRYDYYEIDVVDPVTGVTRREIDPDRVRYWVLLDTGDWHEFSPNEVLPTNRPFISGIDKWQSKVIEERLAEWEKIIVGRVAESEARMR